MVVLFFSCFIFYTYCLIIAYNINPNSTLAAKPKIGVFI